LARVIFLFLLAYRGKTKLAICAAVAAFCSVGVAGESFATIVWASVSVFASQDDFQAPRVRLVFVMRERGLRCCELPDRSPTMNNQDLWVSAFRASDARASWKWEVSLRLFLEFVEPLFIGFPRLEFADFFPARTSSSFYVPSSSLDSCHPCFGRTRRLPRSTSTS